MEIDRPEALLADEDLKIEWIRMDKEEKAKAKSGAVSAAKSAKKTTSTTRPALPDAVIPRDIVTTWMNGVAANSTAVSKRGAAAATAISNQRLTRPAGAVMTRRDSSQGLTSLAIVNPDNAAVHVDPNGEALYRPTQPTSARGGSLDNNASMSAAISMKQTLNRLAPVSAASGAGGVSAVTLAGFKEDRRNLVKPVRRQWPVGFC